MTESKSFNRTATVLLTVMVVFAMMPILLIVIASFSSESSLIRNGYTYLPEEWSFDAYYYMVKQGVMIVRSYGVSFLVTFAGTAISVILTTMLAYPMSRKSFKYRNALAFFVFFTMLFNGGIVPSYIMWTKFFQIKNTIWALIIPNYLVTAFNVILVKNYYQNSVPDSLIEAAQLDGASELKIFFKVMLPLAVPTVATISLFTGICYCDMCNLRESNIVKADDGSLWIETKRQKTGTPENVRLLDIAITIIEKYKGMAPDGKLFPMLHNTSFNPHLKKIAKQCGIDRNLCFHQARHTFASVVCISQGVPIETVSKIMGHRNISTTQRYAKITQEKIDRDVTALSFNIEDKFTLQGIDSEPSHILKDVSRRKYRPSKRPMKKEQ